jgi:hypothetical protein
MAQVDRLEWGRTTRQAVFTKTLGQTTHIPKDQACVECQSGVTDVEFPSFYQPEQGLSDYVSLADVVMSAWQFFRLVPDDVIGGDQYVGHVMHLWDGR